MIKQQFELDLHTSSNPTHYFPTSSINFSLRLSTFSSSSSSLLPSLSIVRTREMRRKEKEESSGSSRNVDWVKSCSKFRPPFFSSFSSCLLSFRKERSEVSVLTCVSSSLRRRLKMSAPLLFQTIFFHSTKELLINFLIRI